MQIKLKTSWSCKQSAIYALKLFQKQQLGILLVIKLKTEIVSRKTNIPKDVELDTEKSTKMPQKRYISSEKTQWTINKLRVI